MSRLPLLPARELIRALQQERGSHIRLRHEDGRVVTVPVHPGQDIARGLLRKILRDAELSPQELDELLQK